MWRLGNMWRSVAVGGDEEWGWRGDGLRPGVPDRGRAADDGAGCRAGGRSVIGQGGRSNGSRAGSYGRVDVAGMARYQETGYAGRGR